MVKKKLLLISPLSGKGLMGGDFYFRMPHLGLLKVAALTPPEWDVAIIDEKVEKLDLSVEADLVGISAMTPVVNRGYEIARSFRNRGVKVVMGGMHPSKMPEEALGHADSVVIGEAENLWEKLLGDFNNGGLKTVYSQDEFPSLKNLPRPDWEMYSAKPYLPVHFVETTRGCPHDCSYCSVTNSFGGKFRSRPVEEVISEIADLKPFDRRFIMKNVMFFVDDNIISNKKYAKEFLKRLIPFNLQWLGQASVNVVKDTEILELMQKSGCMGLLVGFESLSKANLESVGKGFNKPDDYIDVINKLHDYGIGLDGAFVFGLDGDDDGVFDRTLEFINRAKLDVGYFSILTPYPGTKLYENLTAQGRIIDRNWTNYTSNTVVHMPKLMTPEKLLEGYRHVLKEAYSYSSIFKRLWGTKTRKTFFWPMNFGFKQSVKNQLKFSAGPCPIPPP